METPASVPSRAARGVIRRITGATQAPPSRMKPCRNTQARPASQAFTGSPVMPRIGSMMTKTTMNMCGTDGPEGSAQTSARPSFFASCQPIQA